MRSPSATSAIGPPSTASGATCPTQKPCVPPENRPSVTSAASAPRPAPFIAPVTASISRIPGPPFGPSYRITTMSPGLMRPARIASMASSSPSNTRAVPSKRESSIPATFTTLPFGASDPRRIAMPPCAWIGSPSGCTTSPSGAGGSRASRFSAIVLPVTVRQSPCSRPASSSSRITTCTPPTAIEVDHVVLAVGLHVGDVRHARTDAVEVVELEVDAALRARSRGGAAPRSSNHRRPS